MSQLQSRRLLLFLVNKSNRFHSTVSGNPPKAPIVSSASLLNNASNSKSTPIPPPIPVPNMGFEDDDHDPWRFLKFGLFASLAGAAITAGYATYAYSLEEVDEKTKALRQATNYAVENDAPGLEKFKALAYRTAMTVPAKSTELYLDLRKTLEEHVRGFTEPTSEKLLPDMHPLEAPHVFTLVLDLNETLVHSDWKRERGWRTFKRPGVEAFLEHLAQFYEIVVYSDQLQMYVDPIIERLDAKGCIRFRLSRSATRYQDGKHYRDLSKLNRDPKRIIYVSGHALESTLQPENALPVKAWKVDPEDTTLLDLIPFLEFVARQRPADIRPVLESYKGQDIPTEFIKRSKELQKLKSQKQQQPGRLWR
ncbi:hypothetical protein C5167_035870 [Papaver somniferum]|uniref:mitochondrial import inner membrane translocase subunit TIM50-like n=1 Tax=Papaver somniferum TaxID=3469 RepID=UPI000E70526E|nr:mitochondrial import inner membrane translocase subunit TIM50-like [Papaver somniferum]RZC89873.1 hypothetical protein C5167_035870 [Papaver somniferum]